MLIRIFGVGLLLGCVAATPPLGKPPAPTSATAKEITRCFLESQPPDAGQLDVAIHSEKCSAKFQLVETRGECRSETQPLILATANGMNVHLGCIEGMNGSCELGKRYTLTGTVSTVVDRRAFIGAECPVSKDLMTVAACREARAVPLRIVMKQGCTVRRDP